MKVLVTGATGYLGREVVRRLTADRVNVTALMRPGADADVFGNPKPLQAVGDVTDAASLRRAANASDAIVHCAALRGEATPAEFERVNVEGARNVAGAARHAGVSRLILVSTAGVYGGPKLGAPRTEESPLQPHTEYARSKLRAEQAMRDGLPPSSKLTILRPTGLYGPGRELYRKWIAELMSRRVVFDLAGSEIVHPCHVRDLSNIISAALERPPSERVAVYNVAGERSLPLLEIRNQLARLGGVRLRIVSVPPSLAVPAVKLIAAARKWPEDRLEFTLARARGLSPGATYNTAKVERELDAVWETLRDGLREMAEGFQS